MSKLKEAAKMSLEEWNEQMEVQEKEYYSKTSASQKKAKAKYKTKIKRLTIDFYPTELDLVMHIKKQPKKQTYIKDLIRADIKRKENKE